MLLKKWISFYKERKLSFYLSLTYRNRLTSVGQPGVSHSGKLKASTGQTGSGYQCDEQVYGGEMGKKER